jgi:hypothetical protein
VPAEPLAEASVRVRPDTRGFREELKRGVENSGAGEQGQRQGEEFGGKFATEAKKALTKALSDLPEMKIDADSSDADLKLAAIRAELDALSHEEIGVTIDDHLLLAQVARIKAELAELGKSSGSAALHMDTKSAIADLDKLGKDVLPAVENAGVNAGKSFSKGLLGEIKGGVSSIGEAGFTNPIVLAALAPAVVEAGAAVGGLLLTGIGLAGIGAGIAGQINDPRVQQAGSILGKDVSTGFKKATAGFAQPLADELNDLDREWAKLEPGVAATFDKLAPLVHNLGDGAAGFVDKLVPGLEDAAVAAGPLVADFAQWLPQLGSEFSDLLKTMADNSGTLEDGLNLVLGTVSALVEVSSVGVDVGSKLFEVGKATTGTVAAVIDLGDASGGAYGQLDKLGDSAEQTGTKVADSGPDYQALSKLLNQVSLDADDLAGQMTDKVVNAFLDADGATLHYAETQTRLAETLKQNKHAFDIHTKAGQENREMIRSSISANLAVYDSMIKSGYSAQEAAKAYDQNTAALEKQLKKAGFTTKQIDDLIGKYRKVPDNVDTDIAAHGLENAIDRLGFLLAKLNGLDGSTFGFFIHGYTEVDPIASHHDYGATGGLWTGAGRIRHFDQGGTIMPSDPGTILVGEPVTNGEDLIPRSGITKTRAQQLVGNAAAAHGLSTGFDAGLIAELIAEQRRTNELLAGLSLTVDAQGLALSVRRGEKQLQYRG